MLPGARALLEVLRTCLALPCPQDTYTLYL